MATARRMLTEAPEPPAEVLVSSFFNMDSTSQIDIPEVKPGEVPLPNRIIVRTLDIVPGRGGPVAYLLPDQAHPCTGVNDISNLINLIIADQYNPQTNAAAYERPLDLNLSVPTCFIIRLSDSWNWRFSHKVRAVTLGQAVGTAKDNYYNLRHVVPGQIDQNDPFPHQVSCRLAYFVAKPVAGVPQDPSVEFHHPFNLNIEIVFPDDSKGNPNTIPIIVDPDIRHPGGSGS